MSTYKVKLCSFNTPPSNIDTSKLIDSDSSLLVLCCYGKFETKDIDCANCEVEIVNIEYINNYTYICIRYIKSSFIYEYMDGFSPNLNKKLHIGHFSNLVYAKAFDSLGIAKNTIAIYGDTLEGTDLDNINYTNFGYNVDKVYFASKQNLKDKSLLKEGKDDYEGTKVFTLHNGDKLVGVKSNQSTTYFYQDVALVEELDNKTLYLTGREQSNHFDQLKQVVGLSRYKDNITHLGLGLINLKGEKMSSRKGNVIYMDDIIDEINLDFNSIELSYNILASYILLSNPTKNLNINLDNIKDFKQSPGLYVSYTSARLHNLPIDYSKHSLDVVSNEIEFLIYKSKMLLNPSLLYNYLLKYCKDINKDYETLDSLDNSHVYIKHYYTLKYLLNKLGLFYIESL